MTCASCGRHGCPDLETGYAADLCPACRFADDDSGDEWDTKDEQCEAGEEVGSE